MNLKCCTQVYLIKMYSVTFYFCIIQYGNEIYDTGHRKLKIMYEEQLVKKICFQNEYNGHCHINMLKCFKYPSTFL